MSSLHHFSQKYVSYANPEGKSNQIKSRDISFSKIFLNVYFKGQPNQKQWVSWIKKNVQFKGHNGHNQENAQTPDVTVNICNPSTWETERWILCQSTLAVNVRLHGNFKVTLAYITSCLENLETKQSNKTQPIDDRKYLYVYIYRESDI